MASARARTSTCSPLVANGLAGQFVRLPVCGTFKWWYFNAVRGSISNMACGSVPPFPPWSAAQLFEFAGQSLSGQVGGATGVVPEWHALLTTCARLVRADKGRFCLCPIGPVGHLGIQECWRCYKGPMGEGVNAWGGGNLGMGGVQAYGRPVFFCLLRDRCKLKKRKAEPGWLSLSRGLVKLTGRPARNAAAAPINK